MIYLEFDFKVEPAQPFTDILIAELGELGFESFVEHENGVLAYIQKKDWREDMLEGDWLSQEGQCEVNWTRREIQQQNWNAEWERNFHPIRVGDNCVVRAPFHEIPAVAYDIVIEPKMSFGTGHHETTHMMLQHILDADLQNKTVLDMGCGTGVLAILAKKKGAVAVEAIDVDPWCYLNSMENVERNGCTEILVEQGDSGLLAGRTYDIILANINRNILLRDIPVYAQCLSPGGSLFLSGFYLEDLEAISSKCGDAGLVFEKKLERNNWIAVKYVN